ncbi:MAG: hypothetical protein ACC662_02935, partial [Planctomycetota bacterium]
MRWPDDAPARKRLADALVAWVAALDEAEPEPEGVAPSTCAAWPDLYRALAQVEALRREIGIQGRTFARLAEASQATSDAVTARLEGERAEARREGRRDVLEHLLEAHEA